MNHIEQLNIRMDNTARNGWNFLLQKGVFKTGPGGLSVREFIMTAFGYESDFIDKSVRTIFLNYSPVDDIDTAVVTDGDKLSLGGAMPGLVGVVMGRDNPFKSLREGISNNAQNAENESDDQIRVFMKVFSTLAEETCTDILSRGIETSADEVRTVLNKYKDHLISVKGIDGLPDDADVMVRVEFVE